MAPIPKRSEQRRRRNRALPVEKVPTGPAIQPPPLRPGIAPLAAAWYASLAQSGQARFYEPSDWLTAQVVAESIDAYTREPTAAMLKAILSGAGVLMATEGDRRRTRLELIRATSAAPAPSARASAPGPVRRLRAVDVAAVDLDGLDDGAAG